MWFISSANANHCPPPINSRPCRRTRPSTWWRRPWRSHPKHRVDFQDVGDVLFEWVRCGWRQTLDLRKWLGWWFSSKLVGLSADDSFEKHMCIWGWCETIGSCCTFVVHGWFCVPKCCMQQVAFGMFNHAITRWEGKLAYWKENNWWP